MSGAPFTTSNPRPKRTCPSEPKTRRRWACDEPAARPLSSRLRRPRNRARPNPRPPRQRQGTAPEGALRHASAHLRPAHGRPAIPPGAERHRRRRRHAHRGVVSPGLLPPVLPGRRARPRQYLRAVGEQRRRANRRRQRFRVLRRPAQAHLRARWRGLLRHAARGHHRKSRHGSGGYGDSRPRKRPASTAGYRPVRFRARLRPEPPARPKCPRQDGRHDRHVGIRRSG